jgi:hypothetical protein
MRSEAERRWCHWCDQVIGDVASASYVHRVDTNERLWTCGVACLAELVAAPVARPESAR